MKNKYFTINIQEFFEKDELVSLLNALIDSFKCSINEEVENFLKNGAIESAKQGKAATYLVFMDSDNPSLVGYFTLAIKPITVHREFINTKYARKFERVCVFNSDEQTYHLAAYLIAQLGKNISDTEVNRIKGSDLLEIAEGEIGKLKFAVGGVAVFLECEEKDVLRNFYESAKYIFFGKRKPVSCKNVNILLQYIKTI